MKKWLSIGLALVAFAALLLILFLPNTPMQETSGVVDQIPKSEVSELRDAAPMDSQPPTLQDSRSTPELSISPETAPSTGIFDRRAVYGTVSDAAGKPIAGAKLTLRENLESAGSLDGTKALGEAVSAEDGRFKIAGVEPFRDFRLRVQASGFTTLSKVVRAGTDLKLSLYGEAILSGQIRDAQSKLPVAGAKLVVNRYGELGSESVSDADGQYRISLPTRFQAQVEVTAAGYPPTSFSSKLKAGESATRDIALRKGREITGEVLDIETGRPIPGAKIQLSGSFAATCDEAGRFRFAANDGANAALSVQAPGYCQLYANVAPASFEGLKLSLALGSEIEGTVRDREGKGVPGAALYYSVEGEQDFFPERAIPGVSPASILNAKTRRSKGTQQSQYKLPPGWSFSNSQDAQSQKTDAEGRFRLRGLLPSEHAFTVSAWHPQFCSASKGEIRIPEFGQKAFAELVLARGGRVEGKVTIAGKPAMAASVWLRAEENGFNTEANDAGEFGFTNVPEGSYRLGASPQGTQDWDEDAPGEPIVVSEGGFETRELKLDPIPSRPIAGRVLSSEGKPVSGASVNAWANLNDGRFLRQEGKTLADGSFRLEVPEVSGALFQVNASDGGNWASQQKVSPGAENVEIRFPIQGKLRLRVFDSRSAEPVASFGLFFRDPSGKRNRSLHLTTDADGLAEADIPQGVYDLTINASQHGFRTHTIAGLEISDKAMEPLRVDLLPGVKVSLRLTAEDASQSFASRWVSLLPAGAGNKFFSSQLSGAADENGQVLIAGVTPGKYRVRVNPSEGALDPSEIEVPDQESFSVTIRSKANQPKPATND